MEATKPTGCPYCKITHRTRMNYGDTYAIPLPDEGWVHYGCLIHWLLDDALTRNFPGLDLRERQALKHRLNAPGADGPNLLDLKVVARRLGWSSSVRASQVQMAAMGKFKPDLAEAAELDAARWSSSQTVLAEVQRLLAEADQLLSSVTDDSGGEG